VNSGHKVFEQDPRFYKTIFDLAGDAIIACSEQGQAVECNQSALDMFGCRREQLIGSTPSDWSPLFQPNGKSSEEMAREVFSQVESEGEAHFEWEHRRADGAPLWVDVTVRLAKTEQTNLFVIISRDITKRKLVEGALRQHQELLQEVQEVAKLGHYVYDITTDRWVSSAILDGIFGIDQAYPRDARHWLDLVAPDCRDRMQAHLNAVLAKAMPFDEEYRIIRPSDGQERWVHGHGKLQVDAGGRPLVMVGTIQDITERKQADLQINFMAFHDGLTGLPNRALFFDRFSQSISHAKRNKNCVALLFIDLDRFKPVNDRYGHEAGDFVLKTIAARLLSAVRSMDTVARIGGDEFVVMLDELEQSGEAASVAAKLIDSITLPIQLPNGPQCEVGASVGISIYPENGTEIDALMAGADAAMYQSKTSGDKKLHYFQGTASSSGFGEDWPHFDDQHLVGIAEIDTQHKELADFIKRLNAAIRNKLDESEIRGVFNKLISYTTHHFESEKALMESYDYPNWQSHDREHKRLLSNLSFFWSSLNKGTDFFVMQAIRDWLLHHILTEDKSLGEFIRQRLLRSEL